MKELGGRQLHSNPLSQRGFSQLLQVHLVVRQVQIGVLRRGLERHRRGHVERQRRQLACKCSSIDGSRPSLDCKPNEWIGQQGESIILSSEHHHMLGNRTMLQFAGTNTAHG